MWQIKTYFERVCGSCVGVHTAEDVLVTSEMTNSIFSRQNVWSHGPCNKRFAGAQNRGYADPVKSEKVKKKCNSGCRVLRFSKSKER